MESVYSTLKNPTNFRWIQVSFLNTFQGYWGKYAVGKIPSISIFRISYVSNSRETSTWKLFLDFGNPGKTCNSEIKLGSWKTEQKLCFIVNKKDMIYALEWPFETRSDCKLLKSRALRYIFAKGVQMKPLFKKYFTTEDANLYTHWSDPFAL